MKRTLIPRLISALLVVLSLAGLPSSSNAQNSLPVYLIIAPDEFQSALIPFVDLKSSQGFQVDLAVFAEPQATNQQIFGMIQAHVPRPKYVLLVGDTELIPAWAVTTVDPADPGPCRVQSIYLTDLYYTTLDDPCGTTSDLILGRFPVHNADQLASLIDKYLAFEAAPADAPWRNKLSFIASNDPTFAGEAEAAHDKVISLYTINRGFTGIFPGFDTSGGDRLYPVTYTADREDLLASLNQGRLAVMYFGPGSPTAWQWIRTDYFSASDVAGLSGPPVPLVFAIAPGSADYRVETSMADAWLLHQEGGALAYIGTVFNPIYQYGKLFEKPFWEAILTDPAAEMSIGEALQEALRQFSISFPEYESDAAMLYREAYQILGDPSLKVIPCKCGRLTSMDTIYRGNLGEWIQIPVTLTNLDILPGSYSLSINAPAAFKAQINPAQIELGAGKSGHLAVYVQIPRDIPSSSGNIQIIATLGSLSTDLIVRVEANLLKTYLPVIGHFGSIP